MSDEFSKVVICRHCGNKAPMKIGASYTHDRVYGDDPRCYEIYYWKWSILLCPSCHNPTLMQEHWDNLSYDYNGDPFTEESFIFPAEACKFDNLPEKVDASYRAALKVKDIEPNAFAVMIGRTLEFICKDRKAKGKDLNAKLDDLSQRQEIPTNLAEIAQQLRVVRNLGAHADDIEVQKADVPLLFELTESLLDYIYRAPAKLKALRTAIEKRK